MKARIFSALLAAMLLLLSCGEAGGSEQNDVTAAVSDTSAVVEDKYLDDLPEELDLGGEQVTFLYRKEIANEFYIETESGDVVDDALYESMLSVEERLNVDINVVLRDGNYADVRQDYMNHISNSVLAGDDAYDWVDLLVGFAPVMMAEGIFLDISENKYMDFDKPYYIKDMVETVAIDDKLYFISGDASLGYMKWAFCIYFNQRVADDFGLENPYKLVDEGRWTIDAAMKLSAEVAQDLNSDGVYDMNDRLGFVTHDANQPKAFFASAELPMYKRDDSGEWKFTFGSERDFNITDKLHELIYSGKGSYNPELHGQTPSMMEDYNKVTDKFIANEIFMMTACVDDSVIALRNMKDDFGILPFPKYSEEQDEYYSIARTNHNSFSMPVTCKNPDAAGAVMEALSSSNHEKVLPAYFEVALKTKYSRDNDSARMYDLIRDNMIVDFGFTYSNAIGDPGGTFMYSLAAEGQMASTIASSKPSFEAKLESYLESVRQITNQ